MDKFKDAQIVVNLKFEDDRAIFSLGFPSSKQKLTLKETAHILTGAVSMLIRSVDKDKDGTTDYELMSEIVEHLTSEFSNPKSFEDSHVDREVVQTPLRELTLNEKEALFKIEQSNMDPFEKQFEVAKVLGRIDKKEKYSEKMSLKEYKKFFKEKN